MSKLNDALSFVKAEADKAPISDMAYNHDFMRGYLSAMASVISKLSIMVVNDHTDELAEAIVPLAKKLSVLGSESGARELLRIAKEIRTCE